MDQSAYSLHKQLNASTTCSLADQWSQHLTGNQKGAGLIPFWGLKIVLLKHECDEHLHILSEIITPPYTSCV